MDYSEKVLAHFNAPHNVGRITIPDGIGRLGDPSCGDTFVMYIKVRNNTLADVKYLVQGCAAAIATCSALSDLAIGLSIEQALDLTDDDIAAELGGLPLEKLHCSNLAATVLHRAIEDFEKRSWVARALGAR